MSNKTDNTAQCVEPARGPITNSENIEVQKQVVQAKVGAVAPDFEASAYVKGEFKNVKLSDYRGKWVSLCFYPGDFTFV